MMQSITLFAATAWPALAAIEVTDNPALSDWRSA